MIESSMILKDERTPENWYHEKLSILNLAVEMKIVDLAFIWESNIISFPNLWIFARNPCAKKAMRSKKIYERNVSWFYYIGKHMSMFTEPITKIKN